MSAGASSSASSGLDPATPSRDAAPHGINFHDLREAIQVLEVVIGSVDKLRDEILPDICGKLCSIASSSGRTIRGSALQAPPSHEDSSKQTICSTAAPHLKQGDPGAVGNGEKHADGQVDELRDVVKSLHEHLEDHVTGQTNELQDVVRSACDALRVSQTSELRAMATGQANELRDVMRSLREHTEERMQAMYQLHSTQWEERLQALLGEDRVNGQASELRGMLGSLHEHLEGRMQATYRQESAQWEERLRALLGGALLGGANLEERMQATYRQHSAQWEERLRALLGEARREEHVQASPRVHSQPSGADVGGRGRSRSHGSRGPACVGQWRDMKGTFCGGSAIVIAEEGWHPLEQGMSELDPAAASPIEFVSSCRCKLLLPADEASSQGGPFDAELGLGDSLIVTPTADPQGGTGFALTRVGDHRRRRGSIVSDPLVSWRQPAPALSTQPSAVSSGVRGLAIRLSPTAIVEQQLQAEQSRRLYLKRRRHGRMGVFLTPRYELVQVVMIVADAVLVAWATQHAADSYARRPTESARDGIEDSLLLVLLNDLFCLWFTLDLVGRALAEGSHFFRPSVLLPHSFEVFIVVAYILEAAAMHAHYDEGSTSTFRFWVGFVSLARTMRLLRLVHMSELVRHNSAFRELRMMMYALQGAMKSLVWSLVMLMVILLIAGAFFTNGYLRHVVSHLREPDPDEELRMAHLGEAFGTLFASMMTLLKTVTGGKDWGEVYPLLEPMTWPYRAGYVLFQIFAILALLNVITAVFVESTMQRSGRDRESAVIDEISARRELVRRVTTLFEEFDEDGDGQISREELREHMDNEHNAAYFASLGIDVEQVGRLFMLLDRDDSGTVDRDEFLRGCLRLKGDAKSFDLAVLQSDVSLITEDMDELRALVNRSMEKIDVLLDRATVAMRTSSGAS